MRFALPLLFLVLLVAPGCYHASIDTGRAPNGVEIDQPWALGFVYGLIPPPTVSTMAQCPNGVAMVETEHSLLNQVVSFLTGGLVTPMHIKVSCAGGTASLDADVDVEVAAGSASDDVQSAFATAADLTAESGEPVYVQFDR